MSSSMALNTSVPVARSHAAGRHSRRFGPVEIVMHIFVMITFIGLALTGVPHAHEVCISLDGVLKSCAEQGHHMAGIQS